MENRNKPSLALLFIALSLLFFAGVLTFITWSQYSAIEKVIPEGSFIADIPIAGLGIDEAVERVKSVYELPVVLEYDGSHIQMDMKGTVNTELLKTNLMRAVDEVYGQNSFISFLAGKFSQEPIKLEIPFIGKDAECRAFLENEIIPRYDIAAIGRQPNEDRSGFRAGHGGRELDIDAALPLIESAARSAVNRQVVLPVNETPEPAGILSNLELILKSIMDQYQDDGQVTEIYLSDPSANVSFDIARMNKTDAAPEIAFTAASTMKLPIMIASYARMDEEPSAVVQRQLRKMITESKNDETDWMMQNVIGGDYAPLTVTEDMQKLGMKNSFLAGYFYLGAPLLDLVKTEANSRTDINLNPDVYNQTTAKDMGMLMDALYHCGQDGSGLLMQVYEGKVTQAECGEMIALLKDNHLPYLITAGVPDTVEVAHKHGWIEENDGLLHTMGNIAAVYTEGGNYTLSIYTWHPENLVFDEGNTLFTRLSSAVYGYFNPESALQ